MNFLGLDVGTGGTRAVLIDGAGNVVAAATAEHRAFASPQPTWAEQNPDDWRRAAIEAVRAVLQFPHVRPAEIGAVGFSGQMHGAVLLGERDQVLRPALIWCDQRTENECSAITREIGAAKLIELVCNPAITGFTLPKLLWVREHEPEIWREVRTILLPKDYVRFCLTGDKASDVADASGTLLFDVQNRRWSSEMLAAFEIPQNLLPRAVESIEITGTISAAGAEATGLLEGTAVVAGAGDNAAGAVGMGVTSAGTLSATVGTSGVVFAAADQPFLDSRGRIHTLCHAIPGRWHNTGVTQAAGLSLRWFRDNFAENKNYDELTAEAAGVPADETGAAIWLPYLMGERTPHLDSKARAAFVGLAANQTRAHLVRAVLEGVAFSLRDSIEIFRQLQVPIKTIRLGGGGARSQLWRQIQADVYGQPIETMHAEEGAAFGAAILAAVGAGAHPSVDQACAQMLRVAEQVEPNHAAVARLNRTYATYQTLYAALRPAMHAISAG